MPPKDPTSTTTALAVRREVRPAAPYRIPSTDEFTALREMMKAVASTEFVPQALRGKPDAALAAVLYGRELGFPPMTSLKYIQVIQGQPTVAPRAMAAMIRREGHLLKVTPPTPTESVIYGKRRDTGEELTVKWTIEDARRAGLVREGSGWAKYPADMLFARCMGTIGRRLFEDVVLGSYTPQEFAEDEVERETSDDIIDGQVIHEEVSESTTSAPASSAAATQPTSPSPAVSTTTAQPTTTAAATGPTSPATPFAASASAASTTAPATTSAPPPTATSAAPPTSAAETSLEPEEIAPTIGIEALRKDALRLAADSQRIAAEQKYPGQSFTQHQLETVGRRSIEKWLAREQRVAKTLADASEQDLTDVIAAINKTLQSAAA